MDRLLILSGLLGAALSAIVPASQSGNASWPYYTFKTVDFEPPVLSISRPTDPSEGYLFFAPDGSYPHQVAPLIYDVYGNPVWNGANHQHAFAFGVQEYLGEKVLVSWNGTNYREPVGRGYGYVYIRNKHYEVIHNMTLPGNFLSQVPNMTYPTNIDLHEIFITKNGSLLVTANNVTQANLTSVGGPTDGWVVEAQFYEIDIATNKILFQWKSLDHLDQLPFNLSVYPLGSDGEDGTSQSKAWGYVHINAVSPYDDGYIFSSRFLCSGVAIAPDGSVKWRLQGRDGGDFKLGNGTNFCYQHDIRAIAGSDPKVLFSMHDNANSPIENGTTPTSGKVLQVDLDTKDVTLVQRYINESGPTYSTAQGNMQIMTNGNVFIGHGWIPVLEEFTHDGQILSTFQFGNAEVRPGGGFLSPLKPTLSYRAFKQQWVGCPITKPAVVAEASSNGTTVYVSWNGATEVKAWEVYGGSSSTELSCLKTVPKSGFETEAEIASVEYVQVKPVMRRAWHGGHECEANVTSDVVSVE